MSPIREKEDFLVYGSPRIEDDEIAEVVQSMQAGWLGTGPKVARFEKMFKEYKNCNEAAAVNSCTAALHLSLLSARLEPGDEVITTPLTFCATVNAIIHSGAHPVLADVNPNTMNIDPNKVLSKITKRTKAILPVHFAGRSCEMDELMEISKKNSLVMIEDCAHALETEYHGKKAGTFGDYGCFSFYATKNITTGEGGMVLSKTEDSINRIKMLALHGMSKDAWKRFTDEGYKHYQVVECGFKYNMMDLQAAIGIHQLEKIEQYWKIRKNIWEEYNQAFSETGLTLPLAEEVNTRHGYHLYTVLVDERKFGISRDDFIRKMTAENIGVGVHYMSLPEHEFYQKKFGWDPLDFPEAHRIGRQTVSLPFSAKLKPKDVQDVIRAVKKSLCR